VRPIQMTFIDESRDIEELGITDYFLNILPEIVKEEQQSRFTGSPFEGIIHLSPIARGQLGEKFIKRLAEGLSMEVIRSEEGDYYINGVDTEVKFARQTEAGGFVVNQLRPRDYKYVAIVVVRPWDVNVFTIPKDKIMSRSNGQHGGKDAVETFIYTAKSWETLTAHFGEYEGLDIFKETYGY